MMEARLGLMDLAAGVTTTAIHQDPMGLGVIVTAMVQQLVLMD
jgi:hypothetical protein